MSGQINLINRMLIAKILKLGEPLVKVTVVVLCAAVVGCQKKPQVMELQSPAKSAIESTFLPGEYSVRAKPFRPVIASANSAIISQNQQSSIAPDSSRDRYQPIDPPRRDRDAELLAMSGTGGLYAEPVVYQRVTNDLSAIKHQEELLSAYPVYPYFRPEEVKLNLIPEALQQVKQGSYREWDYLNEMFRATNIELYDDYVLLKFDARLNMPRVAQLYESLDGVKQAETTNINELLSEAYYADICLTVDSNSTDFTYIFFHRSSDCLAGQCSVFNYKAFVSKSGQVGSTHDSHDSLEDGSDDSSIVELGEWQWSTPADLADAPPWFIQNHCGGEFWQPLGRGLSHYVESVRLSMSKDLSFKLTR